MPTTGIFRTTQYASLNWTPRQCAVLLEKDPSSRTSEDITSLVRYANTFGFWRQLDPTVVGEIMRVIISRNEATGELLCDTALDGTGESNTEAPMFFIISGAVDPVWAQEMAQEMPVQNQSGSAGRSENGGTKTARNRTRRGDQAMENRPRRGSVTTVLKKFTAKPEPQQAQDTDAEILVYRDRERRNAISLPLGTASSIGPLLGSVPPNNVAEETPAVSEKAPSDTAVQHAKQENVRKSSGGPSHIVFGIGSKITARDAPHFVAGDALYPKMELAIPPQGLPLETPPLMKRFVVAKACRVLVLSANDFERILRPVLTKRGMMYTFASCYAALERPPKDRSPGDLLLLLTLVNAIGGIFNTVDENKRWLLCRSFELQERPRGSLVCLQNTPGDSFYIILTGAIAIHRRDDNHFGTLKPAGNATVNMDTCERDFGALNVTLRAGAGFGEKSLLFGAPRSTTCVTTTPTQLIALNKQAFESVINEDLVLTPWLNYEILRMPTRSRGVAAE